MSKKVIVTDINSGASEKTVKDFFLFCGKIKEFELIKEESSDKQISFITFEKETAAKTALMLTNAVIGDSKITVKSADDACNDDYLDGGEGYDGQEGKSKLHILAEILAAGYQLQDTLLKKGAEVDAKYGLSTIFKHYFTFFQANLTAIDTKYKVTDTVRDLDTKYAVQDKVKKTVSQAQDKAHCVLDSNTGKLALDIYDKVTKQVGDLHCKARQIANEKKAALQVDNTTIEAH